MEQLETGNNPAGAQSRAGEAGANLTARLGTASNFQDHTWSAAGSFCSRCGCHQYSIYAMGNCVPNVK